MNDERSCVNCRHIEKSMTEYPCINCEKNAIDNFEPVEYITISRLIKTLQAVPNQQAKIPLYYEIRKLIKNGEVCILYD